MFSTGHGSVLALDLIAFPGDNEPKLIVLRLAPGSTGLDCELVVAEAQR